MDLRAKGSEGGAEPHWRRGRPATLLVLFAGVAVSVLVWIAAVQQSAFERAKAIEAARVQNANRAQMLQQYVARTLDAANIACLHVAELYAQGARFAGTAQRPGYISGPIAHNPNFLGLSFTNANGDIIASTMRDAPPMPNVRQHPAFQAHVGRDTQGLFVSKPAFSRFLQNDTLWLSRRINNPDGSLAGVVAINLDPAQLSAVFEQTVAHPSEVVWVAGLDGIIRSRRTTDGASSGQDVTASELFRAQQGATEGDFVIRGTFDGEVRLASIRRVPDYSLFVSYSVREDEILGPANRRANLFWIGAAAVTLMSAILAFLLINTLRRRERHAQELSGAKARLEEAQRIARIGDWALSFGDGRVTWSPEMYEMFERDRAVGPPGFDEAVARLDAELSQKSGSSIALLIESGSSVTWETTITLPSGHSFHHLVSAVATRDAHGAVMGIHGTTQDITERRKLESLQDDIAHLARIGEMNALTATLSHELNQPLTAAGNYLSAGEDLLPPGPAANLIREAQGQIRRTGEIIKRMRSLVSKGASSRSVISLDDILEEALAIVAVTKVCAAPIAVRASDREVFVQADSVQIQQVILNLIRNACEAQKGLDVGPPLVRIDDELEEEVVVRVIDNGIGVPQDIQSRLFEPFASSKQSGLGLGLSISRTIIEAHGGTLRAENNPAGGASMSFSLPVHARHMRSAETRALANG